MQIDSYFSFQVPELESTYPVKQCLQSDNKTCGRLPYAWQIKLIIHHDSFYEAFIMGLTSQNVGIHIST